MTPEIIQKKLLEKAAQFIELNDFEKCGQATEIYLRFRPSEPAKETTDPKSPIDETLTISNEEFVNLMLDEDRELNEEFLRKPWRKVSEIVAFFKKLNPDDDITTKTIYNRIDSGDYIGKEGSSPKVVSTASVVRSFGE